MKVVFHSDPQAEALYVQICAREYTPEVNALMRRLKRQAVFAAVNERGETVLLEAWEIVRFYTEERRVLAQSAGGTFLLRMRLYEIEQRLEASEFVRISNSEIVRKDCIKGMDFSLTGTIRLMLTGGGETYVSRRYVSRIRKLFENGGAE